MDKLLLMLVTVIHLLVVLFVTLTPFYGDNYVLLIHSVIVPFMMMHWIYNDDSCFLTTVELHLRQKIYGTATKGDCITCKVISPIYDITNEYSEYSTFIYVVTSILLMVSIGKLYMKYRCGEIKQITDLIVPKGNLYNF